MFLQVLLMLLAFVDVLFVQYVKLSWGGGV